MKRKIIALMVVLVMVASLVCPAYAAEERGSTIVWGELYLYAAPGHAYIAFHNASTSAVYIGNYSVESGETITIGTFSNYKNYICINHELDKIDDYMSAEAVEMDILIQDFDYAISAINRVIDTHTPYDADDNNCTHFATRVWNAVAPSDADINYTFVPQLGVTTNYNNFCSILQSLGTYYLQRTIYPSWQSVSYTDEISLV